MRCIQTAAAFHDDYSTNLIPAHCIKFTQNGKKKKKKHLCVMSCCLMCFIDIIGCLKK